MTCRLKLHIILRKKMSQVLRIYDTTNYGCALYLSIQVTCTSTPYIAGSVLLFFSDPSWLVASFPIRYPTLLFLAIHRRTLLYNYILWYSVFSFPSKNGYLASCNTTPYLTGSPLWLRSEENNPFSLVDQPHNPVNLLGPHRICIHGCGKRITPFHTYL